MQSNVEPGAFRRASTAPYIGTHATCSGSTGPTRSSTHSSSPPRCSCRSLSFQCCAATSATAPDDAPSATTTSEPPPAPAPNAALRRVPWSKRRSGSAGHAIVRTALNQDERRGVGRPNPCKRARDGKRNGQITALKRPERRVSQRLNHTLSTSAYYLRTASPQPLTGPQAVSGINMCYSLSKQDMEDLSRLQRCILALEFRGKADKAACVRKRLIGRLKRRLNKHETADLWTRLGDAYAQRKSARMAYHRALSLEPNRAETLFCLGDMEVCEGNFRVAEQLVDRLMRQDVPDDLDSLVFDLAMEVYKKVGRRTDYRKALRRYRKAVDRCRKKGYTLGSTMPELFESDKQLLQASSK